MNCKTWNRLPQYVNEADNVNTFKNRLDKHWSDSLQLTTAHQLQVGYKYK